MAVHVARLVCWSGVEGSFRREGVKDVWDAAVTDSFAFDEKYERVRNPNKNI